MVVINNKNELLSALNIGENIIVVRGDLANEIKYLTTIKNTEYINDLSKDMPRSRAVGVLTLSGLSTAVAITSIVTIGIVSIVAILKNYTIRVKQGENEIVLERG